MWFAIELLCPHQQYGCTFRGAAFDIVAHLSCCPFSSRAIGNISERSESAERNAPVSQHTVPARELPSPPKSSPPNPPMEDGEHKCGHLDKSQSQEQRSVSRFVETDEQFVDVFRTPPLHTMDEFETVDEPHPIKMERMEADYDHDAFSELMEDLEMLDMTISPTKTPLPGDCQEQQVHPENELVPSPAPSTRRRRLIIEEESDTSGEVVSHRPEQAAAVAIGIYSDEQPGQERVRVNSESRSPKRNRVLMDITTPIPARIRRSPPASSPVPRPREFVIQTQAQEAGQDTGGDLFGNHQSQQAMSAEKQGSAGSQQQTQQGLSQRYLLSQIPASSPADLHERVLQFQGPWQWQVHRGKEVQSQTSTVITLTDITSAVAASAPTVSSPSPLPSPRPVVTTALGTQRSFAGFFALPQQPSLYMAEPSAFLPLLVHVPRYLRPRRK
ncbi:hypothetical protein BGZ54_001793, partial [Gamsiella multidivaricata]